MAMTSETRGRNLLATELLKDGYHERADRVAAGNEFMSDKPAVRACVEAVGERGWQPIETAPDERDVLLYRCGWPLIIAGRFYNGEQWGWSSIEAPDDWIDGEPTYWMPLPGPPAIEAALALPSPVRQGEDGGGAPWIVWSNEHNAFWRANRCGYTGSIEQAGRYTRAEAEAICRSACPRSNSTIYEGTPPEICMPAPEALDCPEDEGGRG